MTPLLRFLFNSRVERLTDSEHDWASSDNGYKVGVDYGLTDKLLDMELNSEIVDGKSKVISESI